MLCCGMMYDAAPLLERQEDLPPPLAVLGVLGEAPHVEDRLNRLWAKQVVRGADLHACMFFFSWAAEGGAGYVI